MVNHKKIYLFHSSFGFYFSDFRFGFFQWVLVGIRDGGVGWRVVAGNLRVAACSVSSSPQVFFFWGVCG